MPFLRAIKGLPPNQQFAVEGERAVLGRHPECDIVLDAGAISRQHAQIVAEGGEYYVEDLGSRNGTYLNGERVQGRRQLKDEDQIKICELVFSFHLKAPPQLAPRSAPAAVSATFVEDKDFGTSTIMSKIDVVTAQSGLRVTLNPEIKLRALLEISKNLAAALSLEAVLPKILESLFRVFVQADRGFILLKDTASGQLIPKAVKYRRNAENDNIRISRTVVKQVMDSKEAILTADATSDSRFAMSESIADFRIRSMMCAPLVGSEGTAMGVMQIDTLDQRSRFQNEDLEVLVSVASQAAFAIENANLHAKALEQQALDRDLKLAHEVQLGFLPTQAPKVPGYDFFQFYEPANLVGGDFFDYVLLPGGRLALFIADVSGKGVAAALLMARTLADARFCLASEPHAARAVSKLARAFSDMGWEDRFVTFLLMVLDPFTHQVSLVNAGHMSPILRRVNGEVVDVGEEAIGVPLGVDADWEYEEFQFVLQPGESLTSFTDGFSEANNAERQLYGLEELRRQISLKSGSVEELGKHILGQVKKFASGYKQSDDMCLLCWGRRA